MDTPDQGAHSVRFDWGPTGAAVMASGADVAVVVDVLTFSSAVIEQAAASGAPVPTQDDSPGARVVRAVAGVATTVVLAGLTNARAVADWLAREHDAGTQVAVVAAGDAWPDATLRPAIEDLWGAGAVLAALEDHDWPGLSPEAALAADAYRLVEGREAAHLRACAGAAAVAPDVLARAGLAGSVAVVPVLTDRGFVPLP